MRPLESIVRRTPPFVEAVMMLAPVAVSETVPEPESARAPALVTSGVVTEVLAPRVAVFAAEVTVKFAAVTLPVTERFAAPGSVVLPMLIPPLAWILRSSAPFVVNAMVSAAGKNIPVLVSPMFVIDGSAAVPSANWVTPAK